MANRYINPSGFTENLPHQQVVEDELKDSFAKVAESYGYARLETASVEYLETLASKGEINKEVYTIGRALSEGVNTESERALHFDLTVPFARYVAQHQADLPFPFRRYQIQKVWRGERPQKGRFREFYQADVDVVSRDNLSIYFDAEVATVMAQILTSFKLGKVTMHINNRKFLSGLFYEVFKTDITTPVLQTIDRIDKIGVEEVKRILREQICLPSASVEKLFDVIGRIVPLEEVSDFLSNLPTSNDALKEGIEELSQVFSVLAENKELKDFSFVLNPTIARGLDYYTGTVYETTIEGLEKYGSICSGGRYADLAGRFTKQKLPGVGMSIGLTRLLAILGEENLADFSRKSRSDLVVFLRDHQQSVLAIRAANMLRGQGLNIEVNYKEGVALSKQLATLEKQSIPHGLVCEADGKLTMYTLRDGEQANKQTFANILDIATYIHSAKVTRR